jgi:hypothetical protein
MKHRNGHIDRWRHIFKSQPERVEMTQGRRKRKRNSVGEKSHQSFCNFTKEHFFHSNPMLSSNVYINSISVCSNYFSQIKFYKIKLN